MARRIHPCQRICGQTINLTGDGRDYEKGHLYSRYLWRDTYGEIPLGHEIHHIDFDPTNDELANLACVSKPEHAELHRQYKQTGVATTPAHALGLAYADITPETVSEYLPEEWIEEDMRLNGRESEFIDREL